MRVKCFFLEPAEPLQSRVCLRRYAGGSKCTGAMSYHDAQTPIGDAPTHYDTLNTEHRVVICDAKEPPHDDPRWPTHCACGYQFQDADEWQVFTKLIYRRTDTGELTTLRDAAPGAIWDAWWYADVPAWRGLDGKSLICRTPDGHDWHIDGRASNCTMPKDDVHKCWVRHGEPPNITVDKKGNTCAAGGGSIQTPKWHGFLRDGWLVVA